MSRKTSEGKAPKIGWNICLVMIFRALLDLVSSSRSSLKIGRRGQVKERRENNVFFMLLRNDQREELQSAKRLSVSEGEREREKDWEKPKRYILDNCTTSGHATN